MDFEIITKYGWLLIGGVPIILGLSIVSALFGSIIGVVSSFFRQRKGILGKVMDIYIDIFRGTPVFVQLLIVYFGIPNLFPGFIFNKIVAACIVFSLNSGAYLSEIMRAGIEGVDKGQIEAAKALGVSKQDINRDIIIPQALRNVLPAIFNEFITLTKETSVASMIGVSDMIYRYNIVKSQTFNTFTPLLVVFITYYLMNKVLSLLGKYIERRLRYD
ncbi:MAG: amino acid ABC transporter permease [Breznakia sp.]